MNKVRKFLYWYIEVGFWVAIVFINAVVAIIGHQLLRLLAPTNVTWRNPIVM